MSKPYHALCVLFSSNIIVPTYTASSSESEYVVGNLSYLGLLFLILIFARWSDRTAVVPRLFLRSFFSWRSSAETNAIYFIISLASSNFLSSIDVRSKSSDSSPCNSRVASALSTSVVIG
ncbi:LORF5 [Gallid alphaherpesvirus 2]|nr:LORF5 [Gallid alphaherpesvirus 2]UOW62306.1 LORF5 [Gallid alphaherpesvirus 2]UOW64490.1 LORF5 [Gallid alphaherpesvirus 2]